MMIHHRLVTIGFLLLLTLAVSTPAGAYLVATGEYTVGGSPTDNRNISTSPSFAIDLVLVRCNAATLSVWAVSSAPADLTHSFTGTGVASANAIQSMGTGTFQVGTAAEVQTPSVTCYYAVFGMDTQNDLAVGSYTATTGTCADNCNVTIIPAFLPDMVWLGNRTVGASVRIFKTSAMASQLACRFGNQACSNSDTLQALNADGFQYGASTIVNTNTAVYDYVAFKSVASYNQSGTFTGDTSDDREIASIATPTVGFVKADTTVAACGRWGTVGDLSWNMSAAAAPATNQIQNFSATGFQVGTGTCANSNAIAHHWWMSKAPIYASAVVRRGIAMFFP